MEHDYFASQGWKVYESLLDQMRHDNVRVKELQHNKMFTAASQPAEQLAERFAAVEPYICSGFYSDEDACLVCGSTDYEDDNLIGFCDICGLSVHRECYGLQKLDKDAEFVCHNCKAFGPDAGMWNRCFLCGCVGGAMLPSNISR